MSNMLMLEQMYEMQKVLDARIIKEHNLEGVDLLPNTVLALQVEIGELANEWRGFKHWSKDQQPRREKMLEEYADCLSFFLQIARQLDLPADDLNVWKNEVQGDISLIFIELFRNVGLLVIDMVIANPLENKTWRRDYFRTALFMFFALGEQRLGFTYEQIAEAYLAKNAVNHQRQDNGY